MKHFTLLLCLTVCLASCSEKKDTSADGSMRKSNGFSIALIPVAECLPLYYAAERGYDKAQGFPLDIHSHMAQSDASRALSDSTDAGFACRESAEQLMSSGKFKKVLTISGKWTLLSSPASRIRKTGDLADRVVAVAPGTLTETLAKDAASKAGLGGEAVMYPHVVCYNTAASMLIFNQIDATVLPEPYASFAVNAKAVSLATLAEDATGYILVKDKRKSKASEDFIRKKLQLLYNMAADSMAVAEKETLDRLLQNVCKISPEGMNTKRLNTKKAR